MFFLQFSTISRAERKLRPTPMVFSSTQLQTQVTEPRSQSGLPNVTVPYPYFVICVKNGVVLCTSTVRTNQKLWRVCGVSIEITYAENTSFCTHCSLWMYCPAWNKAVKILSNVVTCVLVRNQNIRIRNSKLETGSLFNQISVGTGRKFLNWQPNGQVGSGSGSILIGCKTAKGIASLVHVFSSTGIKN
jgi:hypothetical protein